MKRAEDGEYTPYFRPYHYEPPADEDLADPEQGDEVEESRGDRRYRVMNRVRSVLTWAIVVCILAGIWFVSWQAIATATVFMLLQLSTYANDD